MTETFSAGPCRIVRKVSLDGSGPWLRVTTRLEPCRSCGASVHRGPFAFSQRAQWSYSPSVGGFNPDAQYKAPLILVQSGRLAFGVVPDVTALNRDTLSSAPMPWTWTSRPSLAVRRLHAGQDGAPFGLSHRHPTAVEAGEAAGERLFSAGDSYGPGGAGVPPVRAVSLGAVRPSRAKWRPPNSREGPAPTRTSPVRPMAATRVGAGVAQGWLRIALPDGSTGGGVSTSRALGPRSSISPPGSTACGPHSAWRCMHVRTSNNDLLQLAMETVNLALQSPGPNGAFKCIAALDKDDQLVWGAGDGSGGSTIQGYLGYDMSWTAYWLLRWRAGPVAWS